jgi:hypothetical protein
MAIIRKVRKALVNLAAPLDVPVVALSSEEWLLRHSVIKDS